MAGQFREQMSRGGTLIPTPHFNAEADAETIMKSITATVFDIRMIILVLCRRTNAERQRIMLAYKKKYEKDFMKSCIQEVEGKHLRELLTDLMSTPDYFDAKCVRRAVQGLGTDETALIEILCTRSNREIQQMKEAYRLIFKRDLVADVESDTSGTFQDFLLRLCEGNRPEESDTDEEEAAIQAKVLSDMESPDERDVFQVIIAQNPCQLRLILNIYENLTGQSLKSLIKDISRGDSRECLLALIRVARNCPAFFAFRLHSAFTGVLGDEDSIVRIFVSRAEKDLADIKSEYFELYQKKLEDVVKDAKAGPYKDALLRIIH